MFRLPKGTEITPSLLDDFLSKHSQEIKRYESLKNAYESNHEILKKPKKPSYKPDNRIVVNFPKYIVDTFNGFFIGIPIKHKCSDAKVLEYVEHIDQYNDQDDNNAELSKIMSIFGSGYEMYYADEDSELCITYLTPIDAFMIYDDSIIEREMYFVRRYKDYEDKEYGSISNNYGVREFSLDGGFKWLDEDWKPHYFDGVPAKEYIENSERQGLFEPVMPMVNAYNKAISEKANDVDYFADAYLKKLGGEKLEKEDVTFIRDNRIIDIPGEDSKEISVEFMNKPSNDGTQENLLNRLERLIFQISMVANISDENFGTSSGIAMRYKLQAMSNLFKSKERKFISGLNRRYKLLFSHPLSKVPADAWVTLYHKCTPNNPANLAEEAQIASDLEGVVSKKTQLEVLSIIENVQDELDQIKAENEEEAEDKANKDKEILGFLTDETDNKENSEDETALEKQLKEDMPNGTN